MSARKPDRFDRAVNGPGRFLSRRSDMMDDEYEETVVLPAQRLARALEGGDRMDDEYEQRAREIIEGCPQLYDQPCLITDKAFNALVQRMLEALAQARREGMEEAATYVSKCSGLSRKGVLELADEIRERAKG